MNKRVVTDDLLPIIAEQLSQGSEVCFAVTGISMQPFFKELKDIVFIAPVRSRIKKNSILFYKRANGQYILHRAVKVYDDAVFCRGDNQFCPSEKIERFDVLGVVVKYQHCGKEYGMRSFRSVFLLFYVKYFYPFRKLCRKINKIFFPEKK